MIQSILFDRDYWTIPKAIHWLYHHGHVVRKVDTTERFFRFRQATPKTGLRYITKKIPGHIELIIMY
jgi:hypothetical protein